MRRVLLAPMQESALPRLQPLHVVTSAVNVVRCRGIGGAAAPQQPHASSGGTPAKESGSVPSPPAATPTAAATAAAAVRMTVAQAQAAVEKILAARAAMPEATRAAELAFKAEPSRRGSVVAMAQAIDSGELLPGDLRGVDSPASYALQRRRSSHEAGSMELPLSPVPPSSASSSSSTTGAARPRFDLRRQSLEATPRRVNASTPSATASAASGSSGVAAARKRASSNFSASDPLGLLREAEEEEIRPPPTCIRVIEYDLGFGRWTLLHPNAGNYGFACFELHGLHGRHR